MNEYQLRTHVLQSDLKPQEKVVLFAILMKVDWKTFSGLVSVSVIVEMTNSTTPTVKRILKRLVEKKWITRESKHIAKEKSTPALTTILLDNISIKVDTDINSDTSIKSDTPPVSNLIPPSIKTDTLSSIKVDTHTISNNINTINNNSLESETFAEEEVDQEGYEDEFWIYPSSIEDPRQRLATQSYIQAHYHRLSHGERQRLLFPDHNQPVWGRKAQ